MLGRGMSPGLGWLAARMETLETVECATPWLLLCSWHCCINPNVGDEKIGVGADLTAKVEALRPTGYHFPVCHMLGLGLR